MDFVSKKSLNRNPASKIHFSMIIEAYNYLQKIIDKPLNSPALNKPTQTIIPPPDMHTKTISPENVVEVKSEVEHVIEEIEVDEEDDDFFTENAPSSGEHEDLHLAKSPSEDTVQEINVDPLQSTGVNTTDTGQFITENQSEADVIFKCIECNKILPEPDDPTGSLINMTKAEKFRHAYANISSKNPVCSSFLICLQCKIKKNSPKPDKG